ncbi:hypothetical protein BE221DRAFT_188456 [Ostreococcus tauri]|uniref:Intermembrane lipid transfer protein VPS13-like C-terminal domain-containing protein n=1 Tax=Ostreococcus tauri TaxID=70448 RepID=A0A1Y5IQ22_OSTTA|nr:hypothetical protein BE221DRAFT_188456 [Ostreococcus tauri]
MKLATGKMASEKKWNVQPSSESSATLLVKNTVYDRGETADGADESLEFELGSLNIVATSELREVGTFFAFITAARPDHVVKWVHPCNRPREGFKNLKVRMSVKVDAPRIVMPLHAQAGATDDQVVFVLGDIEICRSFSSRKFDDCLTTFWQTTSLSVHGFEMAVVASDNQSSKITRNPIALRVCSQKRIDSGRAITNEVDEKNDMQVKSICLDISGRDFRSIHDALKTFKDARIRRNVQVKNPIDWGKVEPLKLKSQSDTLSLTSMQASVSLSGAQVSVYKYPMQQRPISTIKIIGVTLSALKNINGQSGMEMDVMVKMVGIDDDSPMAKEYQVQHIMYAGAPNAPLLRLILREDDNRRELNASLQHIEFILRPSVILDTVQTFAPRKFGGVFLASSILPKDVNCVNGRTLTLKEDLILSRSTRLLADDPHKSGGRYKLYGGGQVINFMDANGELIRCHSHGSRRKTMARIIIGHNATLYFENVVFKCTRSSLSRFIKLGPGARYELGPDVLFDESEEHDRQKDSDAERIEDQSSDRFSLDKARDNTGDRIKRKNKPILIEANVTCVHLVVGGDNARSNQINILFGLTSHIERDERLNMNIICELLRLRTKDTMTPPLLRPMGLTLQLESSGGISKCRGSLTPVELELSPHRIHILKRLCETLASSFAMALLIECGVYSCIWNGSTTSEKQHLRDLLMQTQDSSNTAFTIWRPVVPSGYGMLADVVKSERGAPENTVWLVRDSSAICALPERFERVEGSAQPSFWRPIAPKGFISLGLIATASENEEPSLDTVRCIRQELVTNIGKTSTRVDFTLLGDSTVSKLTLWKTNNAADGFVCTDKREWATSGRPVAYDIRSPTGFQVRVPVTSRRRDEHKQNKIDVLQSASCATVVDFKRIGIASSKNSTIGFWAPVPPTGYVSTGHCISKGDNPPLHTRVFAEDRDLFQPPDSFEQLIPPRKYGGSQRLCIWKPVPPHGFVSVGVIVTTEDEHPEFDTIACVRADLVSRITHGQLTKYNSFWVDDEHAASPTHFWITNSHTQNFISSELEDGSEVAPDIGFDVGYMRESSTASEQPTLMLKFDAPLIQVGMAFERVLHNQLFYLCKLEGIRTTCTRESKNLTLSTDASLSLMHKNRRNGHLEPIISPWHFSFLLDDAKNDIKTVSAASRTMKIQSKDECAFIISQAAIVDVLDVMRLLKLPNEEISKIALGTSYKAVQNNVIINSTGRSLWVQTPAGDVDEIPHGQDIAQSFKNEEVEARARRNLLQSKSSIRTRGRTDVIDEVDRVGDERLSIAHLIVDVLEIENEDVLKCLVHPRLTLKLWDEQLKKFRTEPLPLNTFTGSVKMRIPHPLHRMEKDSDYVHHYDIKVVAEVSYFGSNGEKLTVSGSVNIPAENLRGNQSEDDTGLWIRCDDGGDKAVQVRIRAHAVEGLTLSPIAEVAETASILRSPRAKKRTAHNTPALVVCRTNDLVKIWWTRGKQKSIKTLSAWHPRAPSHTELELRHPFFSERTEEDYKLVPFGTILVSGHNAPRSALMAVVLEYDSDQTPPTAYPIDFENIWTSDNKDVSFWKPIAPAGYAAIGNIVTKSIEKPSTECVVCVREALTDIATTPPGVEWKSSRGFRKIARGDFILIQNGDVGAGGWTFIKEELSRTNEGVIMATVPPLRKLNQNLCIPCLEDESALEIWFDTITLVERFRSELQAGESVLVVSFSPTGPFETLHLRLGTSHVVQHSTHDLVFDGTDGRLLSRTFVENETQSDLIARVRRLQHGLHVGTSSKLLDKSLEELDEVCLELFEAERYYPFKGWSTPKDAVVFNSRYTTRRNGRASHRFWPHLHPPKGYKFSGPWRLDTAGGLVDASGWAYGATWVTKWPPPPGSNKRKARSTRRRRWVRDIMKVKTIESFSHRTSIHTMRQDQMEEWSGDLAVNDKIILPPVSRNDHYGLLLRRVGEQEDLYKDDNPLQVGRLSEREGRAFKYSNGKDYFILLVQERDKAREGTFGHIPGIQLRIIAPVHIVSAVNCKSRITIFADGENVFADDVNVLEIRRVTSIDSSKKLEFHMVMFAEHHAFGHDRSVLLNVSPAGSPPNLQILWLDVKGYRHLTSPVLLDAKRTKLSGNEITDDDDAEQLLTVDYSNMLLITNASSLEIKTLTWFGVTSTILDKNEDYVNNPPGTTLPAMFLKSHVQQQGSTNAQEFVLGLCVDSTPVRVMVSARSKPVIMTVPTASGNKIALSVSVNIWRETSTFWPTLEVIVQPMLVAVNLTRVPLAIRASGMGYTTLTPSSHPTPFSLDIASAKDIDGVEAKLNDTSIQIADISSGEENLSWSSPLVNLVHYSGAFWAIPRSVEPSVDDIAHFRILPYADEDGDPVNFARPLIIQFSVERSEQGCFRIFFKGGDGASLKTAPIMVNNHLPKPLMLRQVKNHSLLEGNASLKRMSTRQLSKTLIPNDVGMGQSFALHAYASMSWGWSVPGVPMKFNKRQNSAQGESMVAFKRRKFLQLSMSADSSCIVEIDTSQSNFHGFIHLGELEYEPRGEQREIATILGEWRGETFSIFIVHKTIMFDNFSFTKEFMKQTKEVSALMKRKEQHLSVSLDACSLTIVDRVRHSFVELIRISIDHIKLARGSALFAGRSTYNHLIVGALQIDFSAPGAMYPVFVWHDPSIGNFLEVVATMSKGDTDYNIVHRFNLMSPREGIIVRGGEELIWAFWDFFTSLKAQLLLSDASNSQGAPGVVTSRPRKQRDEKLQIVSLCIDALTFVVTFHPDSNIRPKDADARVISLLALSSLQGLRLTLEKFQRSEENTVRSNLVNEFVKYIKLQMVAQTLSIMTSMQTLTNVSTGLDAAAKAVETGFGVLETKKMQKLPSSLVGTRVKTRKKLRNNVAGGVYIGLKRLSQGVFNGVIGLVVLPFKGAREGGIVGCGKGCGKGIANLVVKPVAGAISLAAKTVEGVANTARDVQAAAWELVHQEKVSQVKIRRLPIAVRSDGVIRPYNERDAFGVYIMRMSTVASGTGFLSRAPGLHDHFVSMHEIAGNLILVLTNNRAMAVSAPEMDGHLPKAKSVCEWYISWTDVSSIWIKDTTCVKLQLNVSNERGRDGSYVSRSSFSESLEEETMRFVIRALDAQVAFEIEASARRCWQLVIKDDQFNNE